ncbi:hypothetical protein BDF22DRAFT_695403, partial [Syncephalis plumigaleata]
MNYSRDFSTTPGQLPCAPGEKNTLPSLNGYINPNEMGSRVMHEPPPVIDQQLRHELDHNTSIGSFDISLNFPHHTRTDHFINNGKSLAKDIEAKSTNNNKDRDSSSTPESIESPIPSDNPVPVDQSTFMFNRPIGHHLQVVEPLSDMDTVKASLYNSSELIVHRRSSVSMPSYDYANRLPADDPQAHEQTEAALIALIRTRLLPDHAYQACDAFLHDWLTLLAVPNWNDAERRDSLLGLTVRYLTPGELEGGLEAVDRCITTEVFASMCTLGSRLLQLEQIQHATIPD